MFNSGKDQKTPSSKSTETRQPYTDTGSALACAGMGTALLGFTLTGPGGSVPGQQQDLNLPVLLPMKR